MMKGKNILFTILFILCWLEITSQVVDSVPVKNDSVINIDIVRPGKLTQSEVEYLKIYEQDNSLYSNLDTLIYSTKGYLVDREMLNILVHKTDSLRYDLIEFCLKHIKLFGFAPIEKTHIYNEVAEQMLKGKYFYSCDALIFYSTEYEKSIYTDFIILEEINKSKRTNFISHLAWLYKDRRAYLLDQIKNDISGCYHDNLLIILSEMDSKGY